MCFSNRANGSDAESEKNGREPLKLRKARPMRWENAKPFARSAGFEGQTKVRITQGRAVR